jgi:protoporphyrin/coproporphyrin ferrochelatase
MTYDPIIYSYLFISLVAFLINGAIGYIRASYPKYSTKWSWWGYASLPLLGSLFITDHISPWFIIPVFILSTWGLRMGGRMRLKRFTIEEHEQLEQIPDLNIPQNISIHPQAVTVALLNMGGPKTNDDVADFQKHLFNDARLIRFPLSFLFQRLFATLLIAFRLKAVKERYMQIGGGSPIYPSTIAQMQALKKELQRRGHDLDVIFSFNYSAPFPKDTVQEIKQKGKKHILPLSLYPHYSTATTGSNVFYLKEAAKLYYPELNFIPALSYHLHDGYIEAFVDRVNEEVKSGESLDDFYLIFSAHGLPLYFLTEGDPYPFLISQTTAAILSKLKRTENWTISYQSSVGPLQWMKPSTDETLAALKRRGITKVLIIPVAFVGDHIETIHEIDIEYREMAHKLGIKDYRMSKAIETHPKFIAALADTVERSLSLHKEEGVLQVN